MTPEEFTEKVLAAVRELGVFTDAQQVAEFLAREGIKGDRIGPCTCPIARFITKRIGPADGGALLSVTVSASDVMATEWSAGYDDDGNPRLKAFIGFEKPVRDFIFAFDHEERFPELVAR